VLSATRAPDKEGDNNTALATRDSATVSALSKARSVEAKVVDIIREIGEVVAHVDQSGTSIRSDAVFEYFCEKNMLSLLVEIAKAKPSDWRLGSKGIKFHEVAFSPRVKAQLLQTISILVSNSQDAASLYYLLSNNYVNELVIGMLPLRQWTNHALEEMLPLYVELLRSISIQLTASPGLISFLAWNDSGSHQFPLVFAAVEVVTSSYAKSDSYVHEKCLKLLVSLMQTPDPPIRGLVSAATTEHQKLSMHICQRLLDRYHRLAMLTTGPVVDPIRSNSIAGQLICLQNEIESLNELLRCRVRPLNVRTCECLLLRVVSLLLRNLVSTNRRPLLAVGTVDIDVIPEREALAQVSVVFLSQLFLRLEYAPFIRMLAVAVFHLLSSTIWDTAVAHRNMNTEDYVLTKTLNRIVQSPQETNLDKDIISSPYRQELITLLTGSSGEWRFVPATILLESVLSSKALDLDTLVSLKVVPSYSAGTFYPESVFEETLAEFLRSRRVKISAVSVSALERAGSLAMTMIPHIANSMTNGGKDLAPFTKFFNDSPLVRSLRESRSHFCAAALGFKDVTGVSQLYVDLIELAIKSRYLKLGDKNTQHPKSLYGCPFESFLSSTQSRKSDMLVRKFRNVGSNDVEEARFAIRMAIHFRAICTAVEHMILDCTASPSESGVKFTLDKVDRADNLLLEIGDLKEKPSLGTDLDLRGRMTFRFFPASNNYEQRPKMEDDGSPLRQTLSGEMGFRQTSQLILVLDPTDLFIVKPVNRSDVNRGTIVCSASLRSVIALASDGEWLHVAIRHVEDVGFLIKNGKWINAFFVYMIIAFFSTLCYCSMRRQHGLAL
jgi:protein CLEC16A